MWRRMLLRRRGAWRLAHSAVRRLKKRDFSVELRTIAVWSPCRAVYESNDHRSRSLTLLTTPANDDSDAIVRGGSDLFATSTKQTQPLNAAAQHAPILDEVIASIIRIDLLKIHRLVAVNTIHQIHQRTSVVVLRHRSFLRWTGRPTWAHASPAMIATG
jgi:hypothetical protein